MSTTPRTDAEAYCFDELGINNVDVSFSRQLETELVYMKARAEKAEAELDVAIARAEHAEALIRSLCKICSTPIGAASEASK